MLLHFLFAHASSPVMLKMTPRIQHFSAFYAMQLHAVMAVMKVCTFKHCHQRFKMTFVLMNTAQRFLWPETTFHGLVSQLWTHKSSPEPSSVLSSIRSRTPFPVRTKQTSSTKCHATAERCTSVRLHAHLKHVWRSIRTHASKASWTTLP